MKSILGFGISDSPREESITIAPKEVANPVRSLVSPSRTTAGWCARSSKSQTGAASSPTL